jgi:glycosyltransferase involved in cell wall biosynthesis
MSALERASSVLDRLHRVLTDFFGTAPAARPASSIGGNAESRDRQHPETVADLEAERDAPDESRPPTRDGAESIVIICPDTHITLWPTRLAEAATGGGKLAILRLAMAWASAGHPVTIAGGAVVEGEADGVIIRELSRAGGTYDVAIYVTGLLGHFEHPAIRRIRAHVRLLWQNPPAKIAFPPGRLPDWIVVPARFLAQRGATEWGYPPERMVVIPGEAVSRKLDGGSAVARDDMAAVYASHPDKGLREAIDLVRRVRSDYPLRLDVYGSRRLWNDQDRSVPDRDQPDWVHFKGEVPPIEIPSVMAQHGVMLYVTSIVDSFCPAMSEALAAGVIVIASGHGANAEFIRHGWNGFLVPSNEALVPDLARAEHLLRCYLAHPEQFSAMRQRAIDSVPTWDEQAAQWRQVWRSTRLT